MYIGYDNTHRMFKTWFGGGELLPLVAPMCTGSLAWSWTPSLSWGAVWCSRTSWRHIEHHGGVQLRIAPVQFYLLRGPGPYLDGNGQELHATHILVISQLWTGAPWPHESRWGQGLWTHESCPGQTVDFTARGLLVFSSCLWEGLWAFPRLGRAVTTCLMWVGATMATLPIDLYHQLRFAKQ